MERKSKFCGKCGAPLDENDKFCAKCGATLQKEEVKPESTESAKAALKVEQEIKHVIDQPVKKSSITGKIIKVIVACLCIAVALIFICVRFAGNDNNDISEALLGRDYMAKFLKENKFAEISPDYFESPDGGTIVKLDDKKIPESAVITGGDITLHNIKIGEIFSLETVGKKLTSNGYHYQNSGDGFVTYITELPSGYKEIQLLINDGDAQIYSILFSFYGDNKAEESKMVDKPVEDNKQEETQQNPQVDEAILNSVFADSAEKRVSWYSYKTGYYMIPFYDQDSDAYEIWFTVSNNTVWAYTAYIVNVSEIERTAYGGITCRGKMMFATKALDKENGTVEITWHSEELLDYPTIKMINGNQLTEVDMIADDYSYYGPLDEGNGDTYGISDYLLPDVNKRYYTREELTSLDKDTLRLARNEVFARHHRKFETQDLKNYFESKTWYQGYLSIEEFDDSVLNEYEKGNLDLIKSIEGISARAFEPGWIYGSYECHDGVDAGAEIGWYSDSGEDYISLMGASKDGTGVGEFSGEVVSSKDGNYTAIDEYGNIIDFYYNGLDSIKVTTFSSMGGASFPGFDGVYKKTKDLSHNVS